MMERKNSKYEFIAIIKPFLPEDVRESLVTKIKKIFENAGGKIEKEDIWGKRHLAYKIKGHEEGYYIVYNIELPRGRVGDIKKELNLEMDLLRYMFSVER
ncbi:MAG: 30S ribosomal protein S6 [Candidatus Dojkabacteria bacterium]|jgi:small subunit ribosomal protein S6|nr:30S ribosomal protein S6 [Candidatus Dojkabacteria bacterium]